MLLPQHCNETNATFMHQKDHYWDSQIKKLAFQLVTSWKNVEQGDYMDTKKRYKT